MNLSFRLRALNKISAFDRELKIATLLSTESSKVKAKSEDFRNFRNFRNFRECELLPQTFTVVQAGIVIITK